MSQHTHRTSALSAAAQAADADRLALDKIAGLLGTSSRWDGDVLEDLANIVGDVRPHPGDAADTYSKTFRESTGRSIPNQWDFTEEED